MTTPSYLAKAIREKKPAAIKRWKGDCEAT